MSIYIEIKKMDGSEEYKLEDDEAVTFFKWSPDDQKAVDIPKSVFLAAPELLAACIASEEVYRNIEMLLKNETAKQLARSTTSFLQEIIKKAKGE